MSKIIVSDTSCLILLDKLSLLFILEELFEKIAVTPEIEKEYGRNCQNGLIQLVKPILAQIKRTNFRIAENLGRQILKSAGE